MKSMARRAAAVAVAAGGLVWVGQAHASLTTFQTFVGSNGLSTGGCGTTSQACGFTSIVPLGSTVLGAYLYSSEFNQPSGLPGGTLNGQTVNYSTPLGVNAAGGLQAYRADVTSIVSAAVAAATTASVSFNVTETSTLQDGEALVIAYANASLPTQTVGILDGFSASAGDNSFINFATPLDPASPGFAAEMRIGDGFSYDGPGCTDNFQVSQVSVNGSRVTNVAGCNDDSVDATPTNGNLITIGGDTDPFTPVVAGGETTTSLDHERYNLAPYLNAGDTTIAVNTLNPSNDDNIFLEAFLISGSASVTPVPMPPGPPTTTVPEPATLALLATGMLGAAAVRRRRRS